MNFIHYIVYMLNMLEKAPSDLLSPRAFKFVITSFCSFIDNVHKQKDR